MVYVIYICIVVPMLLLLPLLEKHSRYVIFFMMIGATTALSAYEINTIALSLLHAPIQQFSASFSPVSEELLKAVPVLFFAVTVDDRRSTVLGIAMAVGVGFAILENAYLLTANLESVTLLWGIFRGFSSGLMHGICTMAVGTGITFVKRHKKLFYTGTFGLLALAITFHAVFNLLVQSQYSWIGLALPVTVYLAGYMIQRSGKVKNLVAY